MLPGTVSLLRRELASSRLAVLAGAGVSVRPPTLLPQARDLRRALLDGLFSATGTKPPQPVQKLSLEIILEEAMKVQGPGVTSIYKLLENARPNANHGFLAHLLLSRKGSAVITTNQDMMIEASLQEARHNVAVLVSDNEYRAFELDSHATTRARRIPMLLKLHGSVGDLRTCRAAISQVARGFPSSKRSVLTKAWQKKTLLVLGYSGNDPYDVMPALKLHGPARIVWVEHAGRDGPWTARSGTPVGRKKTGQVDITIKCDTSELIDSLRDAMGVPPANVSPAPVAPGMALESHPILSGWIRAFAPGERELLVGYLLLRVGRFTDAVNAFHGTAQVRGTHDVSSVLATNAAGLAHWRANEDFRALRTWNRALLLCRGGRGKDWKLLRSRILSNIGLLHWKAGRLAESERALRISLKMKENVLPYAKSRRERRLMMNLLSGTLNDYGLTLRDKGLLREAGQTFRRSIRIKKALGDPGGLGIILGNNALLLLGTGRLTMGLRLAEDALRLRRLAGDSWSILHGLGDLTAALIAARKFARARPLLKEAGQVVTELGDRRALRRLQLLGADMERLLGEAENAARTYRRLLKRPLDPSLKVAALYGLERLGRRADKVEMTNITAEAIARRHALSFLLFQIRRAPEVLF